MPNEPITLLSSLSSIAQDIGEKYLLQPFPTKTLNNGLLDYDEIRKQKIDKTKLHRSIHGYQNACRVATLIAVLFEFYKKYSHEFPENLRQEINLATTDDIKLIQITGLMRATGRTEDGDHGYKFSKQGKRECLVYLKNLGVAEKKCQELANAIVLSEECEEFSLAICLLADATTLESLRDTLPYHKKNITLNSFYAYRILQNNLYSSIAIGEFIEICCQHAKIIHSHQGFLLHAIKNDYENPIVAQWPTLDKYSERKKEADKFLKQQKQLEYSDNCFEKCNQDVTQALTALNPAKISFDDLFQEFFLHLNKLGVKPSQYVEFIEQLVAYFSDKIGTRVSHKTAENNYEFWLSWETISYYLTIEKKFFNNNELLPVNLLQDALLTEEDNWYLIHFANKNLASYYLNIIKIYLSNIFHRDLTNAKVSTISADDNEYYRFRLTKKQFYCLSHLFKEQQKPITEKIDLLIVKFRDLIKKGDIDQIRAFLTNYPSLKNFPLFKSELPLHRAVRANNLELIKVFVEEYKVNINSQLFRSQSIFDGMTPLFLASSLEECDDTIVEYLLQMGADINLPCKNGRTPLASSAYYKLETKVKILVASGANPNITMDKGHTALINAVEQNQTEIVKQILSIPLLYVDHKRDDGEFALYIAAKKGYKKIVKLLVAAPGIDLYAKNGEKTARDIAHANGHQKIETIIVNQQNKIFESKMASEIATKLMKKHTFKSYAITLRKIPDEFLYTDYLHDIDKLANNQTKHKHATETEWKCVKARKLWSTIIAETHAMNANYVKNNNVKEEVIKKLQNLGSTSPEILYQQCLNYLYNHTVITVTFDPLWLVIKHNFPDKIRTLAKTNNFKPNEIIDDQKNTLLMFAVEQHFSEALRYLLQIPGIDLNLKRNDGDTALDIAIKHDDVDKVKLLLAAYQRDNIFSAANAETIEKAFKLAAVKKNTEIKDEIAKVYLPLYIHKLATSNSKKYFNTKLAFFNARIFHPFMENPLAAAHALQEAITKDKTINDIASFKRELNHGELKIIKNCLKMR